MYCRIVCLPKWIDTFCYIDSVPPIRIAVEIHPLLSSFHIRLQEYVSAFLVCNYLGDAITLEAETSQINPAKFFSRRKNGIRFGIIIYRGRVRPAGRKYR